LREGPAELRGLAFTGELFFDGPVVVVADEDAAVVTVKSERNTVPASKQLMKQAEIAESGFRGKELRRQDFAGGVSCMPRAVRCGAAAFEPVVADCRRVARVQRAVRNAPGAGDAREPGAF